MVLSNIYLGIAKGSILIILKENPNGATYVTHQGTCETIPTIIIGYVNFTRGIFIFLFQIFRINIKINNRRGIMEITNYK